MSATVRHHLWILLAAGCVFFINLGVPALFDEDEPKNAVCGREMFLRGDWIVPTFNQELRTDKPILIYWLMQVSFHLFGVSELAARLHSSVLAVGSSLLVYHLGKRLFHEEVGLYAGLILCTSLMFSAVGRAVTPDSTLVFCILLTMLAYVAAVARRHGGRFGQPDAEGVTAQQRLWSEFVPQRAWEFALVYAAMGLAVLAKGPIGFLLPCSIWGLFLLVRQHQDRVRLGHTRVSPDAPWYRRTARRLWELFSPRAFLRACGLMRLPLGFVTIAAVALPWYVTVGIKTDGAWLAGFLGGHNVDRFMRPMENHSGPVIYYIPVILAGFFPWSIFLVTTVLQAHKRIARAHAWQGSYQFVACWAGFWITFFSFAGTKLPNYVLPSYPALALLTACYLYDWMREPVASRAASFRHSCRTLAVVGLCMLIAVPVATSYVLPEAWWLGIIGVIPMVGGIVAFGAARQGQRPRAVRAICVTATCLAVGIVGFGAAQVSGYQDGPRFARIAKEAAGGDPEGLATYEYFAPNLVFYSGQKIHKIRNAEAAAEFFVEHPHGFLITRDDKLHTLAGHLPAGVKVLEKQRRFLRRHDLVLMGRPTRFAQAIDTPAWR